MKNLQMSITSKLSKSTDLLAILHKQIRSISSKLSSYTLRSLKSSALSTLSTLSKLPIVTVIILLTTSCSTYKNSWDCPKARGIGCTSLEYADQIAREQIILNITATDKIDGVFVNNGDGTYSDINNRNLGTDEIMIIDNQHNQLEVVK